MEEEAVNWFNSLDKSLKIKISIYCYNLYKKTKSFDFLKENNESTENNEITNEFIINKLTEYNKEELHEITSLKEENKQFQNLIMNELNELNKKLFGPEETEKEIETELTNDMLISCIKKLDSNFKIQDIVNQLYSDYNINKTISSNYIKKLGGIKFIKNSLIV